MLAIVSFNKIYELSSVVLTTDDEVDDDMESTHAKSRHVLKRLRAGSIPFKEGLNYSCPFCIRKLATHLHSILQHATGIGKGGGKERKPHSMAKHYAFFVFLMKSEFAGA